MRRFSSPLGSLSVAAPCPADWDSMLGGERVRFCGQCQLNVYNLSAMSRDEAESLIAGTEGRLCVRFYRRKDGSIITEDCPVGLRALKRRAVRIKRAFVSSMLGFLAGIGVHGTVNRVGGYFLNRLGSPPPYERTLGVMAEPKPAFDPATNGMLVRRPSKNRGERSQSKQAPRK